VRISELRLPAGEIEALRFFYAGRLGLPLLARREDAFCVEAGSTRLWFEAGEPARSHFAVNVPPNRFDEAKRWAAERAELLTVEGSDELDFSDWDARAAYFIDPDGNVVELIARNRLPESPATEPFGASELIEVSEAGLPVPDVGAAVGQLEGELGLEHFDGNRQTFSAVGDDHGLLIVVPIGRHWFPTETVATGAPIEVEIRGDAPRELRVAGHRVAVAA
jgi:catechol-2,3-dioxygenase